MKYQLWYEVVVRDRHGKVKSRERRRARSFLKQWNQLIAVQMLNVTMTGSLLKDINGTDRNCDPHLQNFRMEAHGSFTGCFPGTGGTAVAIDDYKLEAIITNGSGAGQLTYGAATTIGAVGIAGSAAQFVASRSFTNDSGDTITVAEVGIYTACYVGDSRYYMCAIRDVLGAPQDVLDTEVLTVNYTLEVEA